MRGKGWLIAWGVVTTTLVVLVVGLPTALSSESADPITDQERELVRGVAEARKAYQASLERLRSYYSQISHEENRYWVEKELTDYHLAVKAPYILDMDLPPTSLKASKNDTKANRIFREAIDWLNRASIDKEENTKRAEILLQRILRDHKDSDKIDEACYYLGDIYSSKYFQMYRRAVAYYERVFLYQPDTNLDARLRAASIYERHLGNSQRAITLYQEILSREIDPEQTREARRRLDLLVRR
jgi:tetratricopeptide (TPR) repeat protein